MAVLSLRLLPSTWCSRNAATVWADDAPSLRAMATGVDHWRHGQLTATALLTGSARFDGEWLFGTYLMAGLGYGHSAIAHPAWRDEYVGAMEHCIDQLLSERVRVFDRDAWRHDPLEDLGSPRAHAAYLGYLDLLLGVHRKLDPDSRYADLHDRISDHLAALIERSPIGLVQTYPGETYPVDNTAIFGALALHQRTAGADHRAALATARLAIVRFQDSSTGLLVQSVDPGSGRWVDGPRGSGTALAVYFTSFWDEAVSLALYRAQQQLRRDVLGFGTMREYPSGVDGRGDIDSGPVVLGVSISSTGFSLAGSRIHDDRDTFEALFATATLFGAPIDRDGARNFALGGPLGDALMFAMLTARPAATWSAP
ncbi:MAG: hypothetical protein K0V04_33945 [Deltaproteobacteria bacterium]|nr:hypothetical protein [Deltaproteobacteria bacterium]